MTLKDLQELNKEILTVGEALKIMREGFLVEAEDGKAARFGLDIGRYAWGSSA